MHFCCKEILDGLVSRDGVVLAVDNNCFIVKRYVAVSIPHPDVYKDLPTVFGISAAETLKDLLLNDIDERLCRLMGIPWESEISMYGDTEDE